MLLNKYFYYYRKYSSISFRLDVVFLTKKYYEELKANFLFFGGEIHLCIKIVAVLAEDSICLRKSIDNQKQKYGRK